MFSEIAIQALLGPGWGWGHHAWWPWGGLMMVGWWLLIAALVVMAVKAVARPGRAYSLSAEETLAERYARGEIDEQDYRARLGVLREGR